MKKISAIVVTYNRLNKLKKNLKCLIDQNYNLNDIFIINNDSTDGTTQYLNSLNNNKIKVINMKKNLGGAGGFSYGTKLAFENSNSDYFWLMDDDCMPTTDSLSALMDSAKTLNNNFGFLCSNVRWGKDNEPCISNVPHVSHDWNESLSKGLVKLTSATFVSVLVKRETIKKLGLPIADMFIWGDDTEYTTRLSSRFRSYLVSNSIVMHDSANNASNESVFNISGNRIFYYMYGIRNVLFITKKYYGIPKMIKYLLGKIFTLLEIPWCSHNMRTKRFINVFKGIIKGLSFNPQIRFPK